MRTPALSSSNLIGWLRTPLGLGLLIGLLAALLGLVLAFGGPLAAAALFLAVFGAVVVLRDMKIGLYAVILVIGLLPFATIPVDVGVTPTLLDVALGAVVGVWALRLVTGQQNTIVTSPVTYSFAESMNASRS
jgi:hypothetical protein